MEIDSPLVIGVYRSTILMLVLWAFVDCLHIRKFISLL